MRWITNLIILLLATSATADQRVKKLDRLLQDIRAQQNIPALAIAVFDDGKPLIQKIYTAPGEPVLPPEASYRIASISKLFTAQAIMQLQERGALDLQQQAGEFIELLQGRDIELSKLMSHSSGLRDVVAPAAQNSQRSFSEYLASSLNGQVAGAATEVNFHYADINFNILGEIVSQVSGLPLDKYISQHVLKPLDMSDSHYYRSLKDRPDLEPVYNIGFIMSVSQREYDPVFFGSEGLISSVSDLSRWLLAVTKQDPKILNFSSYQLMQMPRLATSWGTQMGLAWQLGEHNKQQALQHAGSVKGYKSLVYAIPEKKRGIIILSNAKNTPRFEIAAAINKVLDYRETELPDSEQGRYRIYIFIMFACLMMVNFWWWQRSRKPRKKPKVKYKLKS